VSFLIRAKNAERVMYTSPEYGDELAMRRYPGDSSTVNR
jgi:hypothetical protein